jgi:hypothetical protein
MRSPHLGAEFASEFLGSNVGVKLSLPWKGKRYTFSKNRRERKLNLGRRVGFFVDKGVFFCILITRVVCFFNFLAGDSVMVF